MADNDQYEDEYQFADLDMVGGEPVEEVEYTSDVSPKPRQNFFTANTIQRNVLIVVILIVLAMILYKFIGSFFAKNDLAVNKEKKQPVQPTTTILQPAPEVVAPIEPTVTTASPKMEQKLSALEISQNSLRSDLSTINNQLGGIDSSVSDMATQIARLNQTLTSLSAAIEAQSREIEAIKVRAKPVVKRKTVVHKPVAVKKYYIQAIIPGRAWLISSNGTTLTIREGSDVPGYGRVKLIDPNQGRVLTSSGQIIRFNQDDS